MEAMGGFYKRNGWMDGYMLGVVKVKKTKPHQQKMSPRCRNEEYTEER